VANTGHHGKEIPDMTIITLTPPVAPVHTHGKNTVQAVAARAVAARKTYGRGESEVNALDGVSAEFYAGQFTAIMGPSGSGKSTLMHSIAGLDTLTSGEVYIGDVNLGKLNDKQLTLLRRDRIGFIFQAFNLVPTLTALENITLPLMLAGRKADPAWLDLVVETVGLKSRVKHRPSELRRSAAARRRRQGTGEPAADHLRRRADRQPRLAHRRRDPRVHAHRRAGDGPDDRHGHPRPEGCVLRRPCPVPRRRSRRRRHGPPHRRHGARPHQEPRPLTRPELTEHS
jgi:ABC-type ATPase involved in cell division